MNNAALAAIRDIASKTVYPFTLKFTREFTKGSLKGLTYEDSIGFCDKFAGDEWVSSVNRANKAGKVDYKVIKWTTI